MAKRVLSTKRVEGTSRKRRSGESPGGVLGLLMVLVVLLIVVVVGEAVVVGEVVWELGFDVVDLEVDVVARKEGASANGTGEDASEDGVGEGALGGLDASLVDPRGEAGAVGDVIAVGGFDEVGVAEGVEADAADPLARVDPDEGGDGELDLGEIRVVRDVWRALSAHDGFEASPPREVAPAGEGDHAHRDAEEGEVQEEEAVREGGRRAAQVPTGAVDWDRDGGVGFELAGGRGSPASLELIVLRAAVL
mmetsp:Transcript_18480/g.58175  ORF Transcript_18480/g.58175 Transcript_18480/m.58175 type:complete len:250 (-) Transcript_18480:1-750(-)